MSQTPFKKLKSRLLRPSFGLTSLFLLIAIVSLYMGIHQSHQRARAKLRVADERVQSAIGATKEILFDEASTRYRNSHSDVNGNVRDLKKLYAYLKASVTEDTRPQFENGGIWEGESQSERTVVLHGNYPSVRGDRVASGSTQVKLDAIVRCRSPWYVFAGDIRCEVELEEAPLNQEFIGILTKRLAELDIPVSLAD